MSTDYAVFLVGLGIDSLSMNTDPVAETRILVHELEQSGSGGMLSCDQLTATAVAEVAARTR